MHITKNSLADKSTNALFQGITQVRSAHEQTIICRQLFAGHVVGSRPIKRKNTCIER